MCIYIYIYVYISTYIIDPQVVGFPQFKVPPIYLLIPRSVR